MSKVICIPCLNLRTPYDYVIHRHSKAKCSVCGKNRQGLLVSITDVKEKECTHSMGCSDVKIKYICRKENCDVDISTERE